MKWPFATNILIFESLLVAIAMTCKNLIHYSTFYITMLLEPCILTPTGLRIASIKISERGWYLSHNIYLSFAVWSIQRMALEL